MSPRIDQRACRRIAALLVCFGVGVFSAACDSDPKIRGEGVPDAGVADADTNYEAPIVCASVAGTRLSREYIEPVPGVRQEFRIMDTKHDVECLYREETDGTFTCYPTQTSASVFYQDANCTSALASYAVGTTPTKFTRVARATGDPCNSTVQEFRLVGNASPVTAGQTIFRLNAAGLCRSILALPLDYYVAGSILENTDFVTATTEPFSATTRVSTLTHVGSDGSSMCANTLSNVDSMLEVSCQVRFGADEMPYCVPIGGTSATYFLDAQCENVGSTVAVSTCQAAPPKYVVEDTALACGGTTRSVLEVTAQAVADRYQVNGVICEAEPIDTSTHYLIGGVVGVAEFASFVPETELAEGRVQRKLMAAGDRFAQFTNLWHDTKLNIDCDFRAASDGSLRCLPVPMKKANYFSDSSCTAPIVLAPEDACQSPLGYFSQPGAMGTQIFAAGLFAPKAYDLSAGFCAEVAGNLYEQTFELEPSSFQLGEKVLQ